MRDVIIEQNNGNVIETISIGKIICGNEKNYNVDLELKETNIKDLIKSKSKELIGSLISIVISIVLDIINKSVEINNKLSIALIVIMLIFGALGAIILFCYILDMIKILKLKTNGKCINFESKREVLQAIIEAVRAEENISDEKAIGKLVKNENGKIYEIKGCKCPICNSEPIGYMYPSSINKNGQYIFECDENRAHRLTFDYKNKII